MSAPAKPIQIHPNPSFQKIIHPNPARSLANLALHQGFPVEDDASAHEVHLPAADPWPWSSTVLGEALALRRGGELHIVSAAGAVPWEKPMEKPIKSTMGCWGCWDSAWKKSEKMESCVEFLLTVV